jgi:hypothetical protein
MEPRGCNRRQPAANRAAAKEAETSRIRCRSTVNLVVTVPRLSIRVTRGEIGWLSRRRACSIR